MLNIPNDLDMMVSYINTLLRDKYSSLNILCEDNEILIEELMDKFKEINITYDEENNQLKLN